MGLFDKVKNALIVEDTNNVSVGPAGRISVTASEIDYIPTVVVDTTNVLSIEGVYEAAGMLDLEKSIYKVKEIKTALGSLPKDTLKTSTLAMMTIAKLTAEEAITDATQRTDVLLSALEQYSKETADVVSEANDEISVYESKIAELKNKINARKLDQEATEKVITVGLDEVKEIKDFIA